MEALRKRSERRKKSKSVLVRLEPGEAQRLSELGRSLGISLPELLRSAAGEEPMRASRGKPPKLADPRLSEGDRKEIAGLIASIARTNGAVVQLAKWVRLGGGVPHLHAEIEEVLAELRDIQRRCDALLCGGPR